MEKNRRIGKFIPLFVPALFWWAAFALPVSTVFIRAIGSLGEASEILTSPYYRRIFAFTLKQASLSTVFSVLLGLPGAYLIARWRFPGRRLLRSITTVPFVLPPILAVLGFILVFGNSGIINDIRRGLSDGEAAPWKILYSIKAIVLAHVFYNFPLTLRIVGDSWSMLPLKEYQAARSLGAGKIRAFFTVDLPRLVPSLLTAVLLTFLYCFLSFAIVLVLGGGPERSTIEVEVYRLIKHSLDYARGSVLAMFESLVALLLLGAYALAQSAARRRTGYGEDVMTLRLPRKPNRSVTILAFLYLIPALVLVISPLIAIAAHSFLNKATRISASGFTLKHWMRLFGAARVGAQVPLKALINTMILGTASAFMATAFGASAAWVMARRQGSLWKAAEALIALPLGVSTVILGLGYLLVSEYLPRNDILRLAILAAAHAVIALPFSYRLISNRLLEISQRTTQAALVSGATPFKAFIQIQLPLARRALISSAVFALALSAGELNATLILAPGDFTTMPLAIYRLVGAYDIYSACALGTILIVVCILAFYVLDRFGENPQ